MIRKTVIVLLFLLILYTTSFPDLTGNENYIPQLRNLSYKIISKSFENEKIEKSILSIINGTLFDKEQKLIDDVFFEVINDKVRLEVILRSEEYLDNIIQFSDKIIIEKKVNFT